jgi:hypothetical protein
MWGSFINLHDSAFSNRRFRVDRRRYAVLLRLLYPGLDTEHEFLALILTLRMWGPFIASEAPALGAASASRHYSVRARTFGAIATTAE